MMDIPDTPVQLLDDAMINVGDCADLVSLLDDIDQAKGPAIASAVGVMLHLINEKLEHARSQLIAQDNKNADK